VIEKVIPSLNLKFVSAKDAKKDLEFFFKEISTVSPEIIGGKLPNEGFYYGK
jgi:NitT/TauT family transport system substrate-binding protein